MLELCSDDEQLFWHYTCSNFFYLDYILEEQQVNKAHKYVHAYRLLPNSRPFYLFLQHTAFLSV